MKGEHCDACVEYAPNCPCITCKHDRQDDAHIMCCAEQRGLPCPYFDYIIHNCPDYEPDDEDDN